MSQVNEDTNFSALASRVDAARDVAKGLVFFDFAETAWFPLHMEPDGGGEFPQSVVDGVDLVEYHKGMELQALDFGAFNILNVRIPPGFRVQRHYHNIDQLVFVLEGSSVQGNKSMGPGEGYFTRAGNPYSITAGPEGLTWMEIRAQSLTDLTTTWVETDPARWRHAQ
jgi:hypothetical protein